MTALTDALAIELIPVGLGEKPANAGTGAYIVIWPDVPTRSPSTMKVDSAYVETWVCHCYGRSEQAASIAVDALLAAGYALWGTEVDGKRVQYPEPPSTLPLSVDRDADPDLYDYAVEWRFRTSAA